MFTISITVLLIIAISYYLSKFSLKLIHKLLRSSSQIHSLLWVTVTLKVTMKTLHNWNDSGSLTDQHQWCKRVTTHQVWWGKTPNIRLPALIARFMRPTWAHPGPTGPRWAQGWPHNFAIWVVGNGVRYSLLNSVSTLFGCVVYQ